MIQLEYDLEVLNSKDDGSFEAYIGTDKEDVEVEIREILKDNMISNTHSMYNRYLSYSYGRKRCFGMRYFTRKSTFLASKDYELSVKMAYEDIHTYFKVLGGSLV